MQSKTEQNISSKTTSGIRDKFLQHTYIRAQSMHLLSNIYPLDDIVITPGIIPPPLFGTPDSTSVISSLIHSELPFLPDWPEFIARYSVKSIPVTRILEGGANIAILGRPGSGKTVALAYLASQIAIKSPVVAYLNDPLPVLFHAHDLLEYEQSSSPLEKISKIIADLYPDLPSSKVEQLVLEEIKGNHALIMLDGLDELPRHLLQQCHDEIKVLLSAYSGNRLILTGPIDFLDGFIEMGISPVVMSYWNYPTLITFINKFCSNYLKDSNPKEEFTQLQVSAATTWITQQKRVFSPLEYTLQITAALTGNETGQTSFDILNTYIKQMVPPAGLRASMEVLAYQTLISQNPIITKYEIDHYVPELVQSEADTATGPGGQPIKTNKAMALVAKKILLQQTNRGNIIFTHPVFLGFLASNALIRNGQCQSIFSQAEWPARDLALQYLSHMLDTTQYINFDQMDHDGPLYKKLFSVAHWLPEAKTGSIYRPQIMRRLAQTMNSDNQPLGIRAQAVAALVLANEKNISGLFKQYIASTSASVRLLSALAAGVLQENSMLKDLGGLLSDPDQHVRIAACMAIAIMDDPGAEDLTARILLQADEQMRRTAAELLTIDLADGPHTLKDGVVHQDILVRRACVYALGLIDSPWSKSLLQKIQVEDSQWVIRNTAAAILENQETADAQVPKHLEEHYMSPWFLAFANRQHEGISPTVSPIPLLLKVFDYGSDEEKAAALEFLSRYPLEGVIAKMYDLLYGNTPRLRDLALYSLWILSLSGVQFPSTMKFGFN